MSTDVAIQDVLETQVQPDTPDYILNAVAAAAEWQMLHGDGRANKFTPQVIVKLLTAVREGMHYEPACALAGVTYQQLRNWLHKADDEGPETAHGRVALALKMAEAEAEGETVRYVRAASRLPQFWAAGMTFLERRHPDRWRRPEAAPSVNVQVGVALGFQVSDEQRRAIVPVVTIAQIPNENGVLPQAGDTTIPDATFASEASLSPVVRND